MKLLVASFALTLLAQGEPVTCIPVPNEGPTKAGSYNWMDRHEQVLKRVKQGNVDLIFIGDSITHGWNKELWDKYYARRNAVNMGFGWDGTQHVLWRLEHGEVDGISPKVAVLLIGVNNIGWATPADTASGVQKLVRTLRQKLPSTKVLVLGVFPWKHEATAPERGRIAELNRRVLGLIRDPRVTFLDFGRKFLEKDGTLSKEIMPDFLHLSPKGYAIWVEQMEPTLKKLMGD